MRLIVPQLGTCVLIIIPLGCFKNRESLMVVRSSAKASYRSATFNNIVISRMSALVSSDILAQPVSAVTLRRGASMGVADQTVAWVALARGDIMIQPAALPETAVVAAILCEAAAWLEQRGMPLWQPSAFEPHSLATDVASGQYMLARWNGSPAGTFKYQYDDTEIWPDARPGEAAYIHRVAICRRYAGSGLAAVLLQAAAARAQRERCRYLRLDCEFDRLRLRAIYERCGFTYDSDHLVEPYHVARYQLVLPQATEG
jgi:GNAT superfamily N-acetyltransferase